MNKSNLVLVVQLALMVGLFPVLRLPNNRKKERKNTTLSLAFLQQASKPRDSLCRVGPARTFSLSVCPSVCLSSCPSISILFRPPGLSRAGGISALFCMSVRQTDRQTCLSCFIINPDVADEEKSGEIPSGKLVSHLSRSLSLSLSLIFQLFFFFLSLRRPQTVLCCATLVSFLSWNHTIFSARSHPSFLSPQHRHKGDMENSD